MKKILPVLMCVLVLMGTVSLGVFATNDEKNEEKQPETTEFVLEIDVNKRYTDIVEDTYGVYSNKEEKKELSENQKTVYIAVVVTALVISVVILVVSLKRVPKEEDIDISGQNKKIKDKEK